MADPAPKPRPRGAERVRRINAKRPADVTVTLVGSSTAMTPTVAALIAELIELARGTVSQDVADAQIDRLGRARRDAQAALAEAQRRAAGIRGAVSGDRLAESLADLARGCELAATRPDLRRRVARGLIARAVWRPGVVAADLTIDVPSRVQVDGSACRPGIPVRLGAVTIGTDEYRRRAA